MRHLWTAGPRVRRAQASFETMSVFALLFIILIPVLLVFYTYAGGAVVQMRQTQIAVIGNDIIAAAEEVHYIGVPSRYTLLETFPSGIENMSIMGRELVFTLTEGGEMAFLTSNDVNIRGSFEKSDYTAGEKTILLEAQEGAVNISIS